MNTPDMPSERLQAWLEDIAAVCVSHGLIPEELHQDCAPSVVELEPKTQWLVVDAQGFFFHVEHDPCGNYGFQRERKPSEMPRAYVEIRTTAHARLTAAARVAELRAKP